MKRISLLLLLICGILTASHAQDLPSYVRIRVPFPDYLTLPSYGVPLEEAMLRPGVEASLEVSERVVQRLQQDGVRYDLLISDMASYYAGRARDSKVQGPATGRSWPVPSGFQLGSMGGHLTYQEILNTLDSMASHYPHLITSKQPIGTYLTQQGRPIYWVRISDNPQVAENEPQVLYTSLHHAREPAGLMTLVYYMYYLLEGYGNDPEVTYLINNRDLYFVLVVNPDGYVFNQSTNPNGGGMWRKNLRNNGDGSFGVDINRNYGYKWGLDNTGSSPFPQDDTYRGPSAFSEHETQALRDFCNSHTFRLALNYHTYSNLLLYPWGWTSQPSPDDSLFHALSLRMTRDNQYVFGPGATTIYFTNGGSDDWMYGDTMLKPAILSFTPELGGPSDGFWASPSRIIPICQENMWQNLIAAHVAGPYADLHDLSQPFLPALSGHIPFEVQRLGADTATYTISLQGLTGFLSVGGPVSMTGLTMLEKRTDSIAYQLNPAVTPGQPVSFVIGISHGGFTRYDTLTKVFGQPLPLFQDHAANMQNWSTNGWGLASSHYVSAPYAFADSPSGNYWYNTSTNMTLNTAVNLTSALYSLLSFQARWEIEDGYDYVQVKVSDDNGLNWTALRGNYSNPAINTQPFQEWVYDGFQTSWIKEYIDLSAYNGKTIRLRFSFVSDGYEQYDGFYVDDIQISTIDISAGIVEEVVTSMQVFPNPADRYINLRWEARDAYGPSVIEIYSSQGQCLMRQAGSWAEGRIELDIRKLSPGYYHGRILSEGKPPLSFRFIRQ